MTPITCRLALDTPIDQLDGRDVLRLWLEESTAYLVDIASVRMFVDTEPPPFGEPCPRIIAWTTANTLPHGAIELKLTTDGQLTWIHA